MSWIHFFFIIGFVYCKFPNNRRFHWFKPFIGLEETAVWRPTDRWAHELLSKEITPEQDICSQVTRDCNPVTKEMVRRLVFVLDLLQCCSSLQALSQKPESRAARESPRATIFRHVALNGISCDSRLHQWIGNFEELIVAFSCKLPLFFPFIQRYSMVWFRSWSY